MLEHLGYYLGVGVAFELKALLLKLGFKLREAQLAKVPYMLVIGDNEMNEKVISVRSRRDGDLGTMSLDAFIDRCEEEVRLKK